MLVDFYHLAMSPLERVLPQICEKIISGGERLLIVADEPQLGELNRLLWSYARDAFLPHGLAGDQPIMLSPEVEPANGATNIALADGVWRDEALAFARTFYFFDAARVDAARSAWRTLKDNGDVEARYWKQDDAGKWVQGP